MFSGSIATPLMSIIKHIQNKHGKEPEKEEPGERCTRCFGLIVEATQQTGYGWVFLG